MNIPLKVKNLTKKFGTANPFSICEYMNISILFMDIGTSKGFYKKYLGQKIIVLNSELSEFDMEFTLAHELGHSILHDSKDILFEKNYYILPKNSRWENEANLFAKELLKDRENYSEISSIKLSVWENIKNLK